MTGPAARDIAFVAPPSFRSCPAESAVNWADSLAWVDEDSIRQGNSERKRRFQTLAGDDVAVYFEIGGNVHQSRENYGLAVRRDNEWSYQTAESPSYGARPPLPPPPNPDGSLPPPESYSCTGLHLKARGAPTERLETALEAFLDDGCRAYLPVYVPAPLHLLDPEAQACGYGADASIIVETAYGTEHYAQTCPVPGSTLSELMSAFEAARRPDDFTYFGISQSFSVTLQYPPSETRLASACREVAESRGYQIDFDDPFEW